MMTRLALALVAAVSLAAPTPAPPWAGLPVRTTTHGGTLGDPVNVALEGSQADILAAFGKIGWVRADPLSPKNDIKLAEAAVLRRSYPTAPVSNLYLFKRAEDFAVEHELGSVARRDHARFWDTRRRDPATGLQLWIGDASRDIGIKVLLRHKAPVGTTHKIDANLDAERGLIVAALKAANVVSTTVVEQGIGPTTDGRNGGGDRFYTDGKVDLIVLKGQ